MAEDPSAMLVILPGRGLFDTDWAKKTGTPGMERAAAGRMPQFSPYGSQERKTVYVYGHLQSGPSILHHDGFGMIWNVEGWAMPPILERAGPERSAELVQRVAANLTTTFKSDYGRIVSLPQVLDRETMIGYCKQTTGGKVLVKP